jgi:hypothetical protein
MVWKLHQTANRHYQQMRIELLVLLDHSVSTLLPGGRRAGIAGEWSQPSYNNRLWDGRTTLAGNRTKIHAKGYVGCLS